MATHPKILGVTLDLKRTYSTHIHNISVHTHTPLQIIKSLTATWWGTQKETLMATYKGVLRPALEYASSLWSPLASSTSINKLQVIQNAVLWTATGYTQDTNIQHLHVKHSHFPYTSNYAPRCHHWISGQTTPEWRNCCLDGLWNRWMVDHKRDNRTPYTSKGRQQQQWQFRNYSHILT